MNKEEIKTWFSEKKENAKEFVKDHKAEVIGSSLGLLCGIVSVKKIYENGYTAGARETFAKDVRNSVYDTIYSSSNGIRRTGTFEDGSTRTYLFTATEEVKDE